jgi:hypothetical protein
VRDPENIVDPAAGELGTQVPTLPSDGSASQGIADPRAIRLERALRLGRQLRMQVAFDDTGWLRGEVDLIFTKKPDGTIWPVKVRVGREATDEDVLARGGPVARCAQYNAAIRTLRQLGERLAQSVQHGRITLAPGSPVEYAHRVLSRLDELIARRQLSTMGNGTVCIATLVREIDYFERCDAHLAPLVQAAEREALAVAPRDASPPRPARRWLRWMTRGPKGARYAESRR